MLRELKGGVSAEGQLWGIESGTARSLFWVGMLLSCLLRIIKDLNESFWRHLLGVR